VQTLPPPQTLTLTHPSP